MNPEKWENRTIKNSRGLKLSVLLREAAFVQSRKGQKNLPGRHSFSGSSDQPKNPLVIVCHGFTGSKEGRGKTLEMGDIIAGIGFDTLTFDFAGCGESEGEWADISLTHQIEDLGAIVDWALDSGYRNIVLNGRSFGGTTVLCYGAEDSRINAICTWAAVASLTNTFNRLLLSTNQAIAAGEGKIIVEAEDGQYMLKKSFFDDLKKHDPLKAASLISPRSLLLIHGSADESVPIEDAEYLFQAAGEPKKRVIIKGADHRFSNHISEVWSVFFSWLDSLTGESDE